MPGQIDESWYIQPEGIPQSTSAGGIVVRIQNGQAWIALVREEPYSDYILPKGRVEPGESLESAARREIAEEAGLTRLKLVASLGSRQRLNFARTRWVTIHYFLFLTTQQYGHPKDKEHRYRCEWFPLNQLPAMFWPEQQQLIEEYRPLIEAMTEEPYTSAKSHHPPA